MKRGGGGRGEGEREKERERENGLTHTVLFRLLLWEMEF